MYKKIGIAALTVCLGFSHAAASDPLPRVTTEVLPQVEFGFPQEKADDLLAGNVGQPVVYTLPSPERAVQAYKVKFAPLTNVQDMAARPPFWGPVDIVVVGLAGIAAIFMRLLLVRQRKPRFAGGISVETIE